jgi:RNA polymerase subunit RPABC4/transcription elongation factor Spt4
LKNGQQDKEKSAAWIGMVLIIETQ